MNAGFSSKGVLKAYLLGDALKGESRFDDTILLIGLGMAAAVEGFCQRKFGRVVDAQEILPADRVHFFLPRYPVETVSAIDVKISEAEGWVAQTVNEFVRTIDLQNGLVYLPAGPDAGDYLTQVRFTYTGGFWWPIEEPESKTPEVKPDGATLLPDDLRIAWLLQCKEVWNKEDKLGLGTVDKPDEQTKVGTLTLSPLVKQMLSDYVRSELV